MKLNRIIRKHGFIQSKSVAQDYNFKDFCGNGGLSIVRKHGVPLDVIAPEVLQEYLGSVPACSSPADCLIELWKAHGTRERVEDFDVQYEQYLIRKGGTL